MKKIFDCNIHGIIYMTSYKLKDHYPFKTKINVIKLFNVSDFLKIILMR